MKFVRNIRMDRKADSIWLRQTLATLVVACWLAVPASGLDLLDRFDPYVVEDIEVSAVAADAVLAKKQALDQALTESANRVMRRVVAEGPPPDLTPEQAEGLLASLENSAESVGPTGYAATMTITYSPMLVRGFLAKRGVAVVDEPAPPVLLIPVVVEEGVQRWWDEAADWTVALAGLDMADRLTPIRVAGGTAQDRAARRELLLAGDHILLGEFRVRYRVHSAVIVRLDRVPGEEGMLVSLAGEDGAGFVDLTLEVPAGGMPAAAEQVADALSQRWRGVAAGKGNVGVAFGNSLPVRALLNGGPADWDLIRGRLEKSTAITGLSVEAIGGSQANIVIWFAGDPTDLPARLAAAGLDLFEAGGAWLLQPY